MRRDGCKYEYIARELNISKSAVGNIIHTLSERGTTESRERSGRPNILSDRDKRSLVRIIHNSRRTNLTEIASQIMPKMSIWTIRRTLYEIRLNSRIARVKPFL